MNTSSNTLQSLMGVLLKTKKSKGFTLIELLVVISIVVVITGITLANYSEFGAQTILRNLTYDVALSVRQAQVFGVASKSFQGNFTQGHGIYIDLNSSKTKYTLYTDSNGNGFFTPSAQTTEMIKVFNIGRGFQISKICVPVAGVENCGVTKFDSIFKRPQPDANIRVTFGNGILKNNPLYSSARVVIASPGGKERSVLIGAAGQISVQR